MPEYILFNDRIKLVKEYYEKLELPDDKSLHKFLFIHLLRFCDFLAQGQTIGYYSYKLIKTKKPNIEFRTSTKILKKS
ncbi:MAG TPA: hypothetical protein ENG63_03075 [Candidatus Desulfofervidus auxilii]|uniref:Uncharacterized protein n=1 Tax=Desulfofervidus auxilii TaxID=1621989 RepID=A0A7C0Y515_DESA2|nr:hypothetical protein [Candidatus Desulfofervidus auxilii]